MKSLYSARSLFRHWLALIGILLFLHFSHAPALFGQTGTSGTISGTVKDPSGAVVANATVTIDDPVSGYMRTDNTSNTGIFTFPNVPFNPYHLTVTAAGFASFVQDVDIRSGVPVNLNVALKIGTASESVVVTGAEDIVENTSTTHTDIDRNLFDKLPLESQSSSLSSLVTLASPGVAADSNGLFHGLGDHAENSFSVDGQPITDQQSKVFSNQLPVDAVQSLEVIEGAPPVEYGGKTSLVIDATTRSGLGLKQPTGEIIGEYGLFGTGNGAFNLGWGGDKWGNFIAANYLNTDRFLDPPEFQVMHAGGDQQNLFDRVDYKFSTNSSLSMDVNYTRSWFQTPNSYDAQDSTAWLGLVAVESSCPGYSANLALGPNCQTVPAQNQRSLINTLNISPSFTRIINTNTILTVGAWVRGDQYTYTPSSDPFSDLTPDLQSQSIAQYRTLTNTGARATVSYVKGINNIKAGFSYEDTLLHENDQVGIVDPTVNPVCLNADGSINVNPGITSQTQCGGPLDPGGTSTPICSAAAFQTGCFSPSLGCYDLTRTAALPASDGCPTGQTSSSYYDGFNENTTIREIALYAEDTISISNFNINFGVRGDFYHGLSSENQAEPRGGVSYNVKKTNTILRVSYAHTMESPFNENLILSSTGCNNGIMSELMLVTEDFPCTTQPLRPGIRNEYHAGIEQAFTKHFVLDGEYIWKYTARGYDFNVLGATPITLPIEWEKSKIPGFTVRGSVPVTHGFSAYISMSSVAARFFPPTVAGIAPPAPPGVFRIDHDERFNQTTHFQYQPSKLWPWLGFTWRYDSGLVAGATPCYNPVQENGEGTTCYGTSTTVGGMPAILMNNTVNGLPLSPDQEFQAGFTCNGAHATPPGGGNPTGTPIGTQLPDGNYYCLASQFGSTLIKVPAPGTENDDHNPQRIAPRSLFDLSIGEDDLFHHFTHSERYRWSAQLTVINLSNATALYNFLSTFSGTHYVTPRTVTGQLGFHF